MNAHTKLQLHLSRWMYKRGQFKGDAPADTSRRSKSYFRIVKGNGGQMIVRMHNADLITAYEDGSIKLDTEGWHGSPTTRLCMNAALREFFGTGYIGSVRYRGYPQTGIRVGTKTYRYYDNMEFSAEGVLLTPPKVFTVKITDRKKTAEFRKDIKDSGFVGMFPILYEVATTPEHGWITRPQDKICNKYGADSWPEIVAIIKYPTYHARTFNKPQYPDHKAALKALIASHTKNMTKLVDTDVTVL